MVVDDGLGIDGHGVVDGGQDFGGVDATVGAVGVAAGGDSGSGARAAFAGEVFKE